MQKKESLSSGSLETKLWWENEIFNEKFFWVEKNKRWINEKITLTIECENRSRVNIFYMVNEAYKKDFFNILLWKIIRFLLEKINFNLVISLHKNSKKNQNEEKEKNFKSANESVLFTTLCSF